MEKDTVVAVVVVVVVFEKMVLLLGTFLESSWNLLGISLCTAQSMQPAMNMLSKTNAVVLYCT